MKKIKTIHLRRFSQVVFLLIFLVLFLRARDPLPTFLPPELFLRLDPFAGLTAMLASRTLIIAFLPAAAVITLTYFLGRSFCGWVCPLGTSLDIWNRILPAKGKPRGERRWKYALLIAVIAGSLFSFQLAWMLDPLVTFNRALTLSLYPLAVWLTGGAVDGAMGFPISEGVAAWLWDSLQGWFLPLKPMQSALLLTTLILFIGIFILERWGRRWWCRVLCPLGAFLGVISHFSPFGRKVSSECNECSLCRGDCRMGAIEEDFQRTRRAECILCLQCKDICDVEGTTYTWHIQKGGQESFNPGRRRTLGVLGGAALLGGVWQTQILRRNDDGYLIRPPGAVTEERFLDLCLRCEECVKACRSTGGCLEPAGFRYGIGSFWTPLANMRDGYCEYSCTLCGEVCPSGAIKPLTREVKQKKVIGLAIIDRSLCIPWRTGEDCIVCEEHCPTPKKAILFRLGEVALPGGVKSGVKLPYVDETLCIGCGICEYKCPVIGPSAIRITRENEQREAG